MTMQARTAARIEDLEFLIGHGVPAADAVRRVGWTLAAAERALYRHRRFDLAGEVVRARQNHRRAK